MKLSNSGIQLFKSCRRAYELKYIEGVYPLSSPEVLERGRGYHEKLESLLRDGSFEQDDPKTDAMVMAFQKYVLPKLGKVEAVEEWFEKPVGNGKTIIGRCDGRLDSGRLLEHKTTSASLDEAYVMGLQNDEQILTYMWAYGVNNIQYTVCRTPTIRLKQGESEDEFRQRCLDWYSDDTEHKIGVINVYRSPEEVAEFGHDLELITDEIENCHNFYRVPSHCMKWGRPCEYASICRNYDPQMEYVGFERRERFNETDGTGKN